MEIEFLTNFSYHLCVSPYRFYRKNNKGDVEIGGSRVRKGLCCFLHVSAAILSLMVDFYPKLKNGLRQGDPRFIFTAAIKLTGQCYTFSVLYILWYRREGLRKVAEELFTKEPCRLSCPVKLVLVMGTLLPLGLWLYPHDADLYGMGTEVLGCSQTVYNSNNSSTYVPLMKWIWAYKEFGTQCHHPILTRISLVVQFIFYFYIFILWGFCCTLLLACAMSVHRMAANLQHDLMTSPTPALIPPLKSLMEEYNLAKSKIGKVNKVLSISPLLITVAIVMGISIQIPWTLARFELTSMFGIALSLLVLGSFFVAAEANKKMGEVEKFIISSFPMDAPITSLTLQSSPGDCGLKGWNFFTFSYSFLGSVGSAIFTYVLVVIQLPH